MKRAIALHKNKLHQCDKGMAWYKLSIFFRIPITMLLLAYFLIYCMDGIGNIFVYITMLVTVAIMCILFVSWRSLFVFKRYGYITYLGISLIFIVAISVSLSFKYLAHAIVTGVLLTVIFILEIIYYNKRKHLFE